MVVKSLLVISVAALHLAIVPGCPGTNRLMLDVKAATEHIQGMDPVRLLDQCGRITKIADRPPDKVHSAMAAVFLVGINKALSAGLFQHGILIESVAIFPDVAGCRHIFHVHLPLLPQLFGRVIVSEMLGFFLGGLCLFAIAQPYKDAVQRAGMPGISFVLPQLAI